MAGGYEPRWDLDLPFGEWAEGYVKKILGADSTTVEVKRKRRNDLYFYIETEQKPKGCAEYKPSGISTTEAIHYAFVIADSGMFVFVPTALVRAALPEGKPKEERDGDNPTRGQLIGWSDLVKAAQG